MVIRFDASSTNNAQHLGTLPKGGMIKVWGFFPFWIGKDRAGLESPQPNPTAANLEVRDGVYVANNPQISGYIRPLVLPWEGELWILNSGAAPGESISNIVYVDKETPCGG